MSYFIVIQACPAEELSIWLLACGSRSGIMEGTNPMTLMLVLDRVYLSID
jgi:hypothetical protein